MGNRLFLRLNKRNNISRLRPKFIQFNKLYAAGPVLKTVKLDGVGPVDNRPSTRKIEMGHRTHIM